MNLTNEGNTQPFIRNPYSIDQQKPACQGKYAKEAAASARRVWLALAVTTAVTVTVAIAATVILPGYVAMTAVAVAAVALSVTTLAAAFFCISKMGDLCRPYFSNGTAIYMCNIASSLYGEAAALLPVAASRFNDLASKDDEKFTALTKVAKEKVQSVLKAEKESQPASTPKTPILLVHGYWANSFCWQVQKQRLEAEGFNVYTINLGDHPLLGAYYGSIENVFAESIQKRVDQITDAHPHQGVIVVGHSMGGVGASKCAVNMARKGNSPIKAVVTLGSPLHGTHVAGLGCTISGGKSECAHEMRYESDFTTQLNADVSKLREENTTHFYNFSSDIDIVIRPCNSAIFKDQPIGQQRHYASMGHLEYVVSGEVADDMLDILNYYNPQAV